MIIHRAVEFSRLIFLADELGLQIWTDCENSVSHKNSMQIANWWMDDNFERKRRIVVSQICKNQHTTFFQTSCEFNAMQGGRFNPSRSFGMLYCSNSPAIACFEVLYHLFDQAFPLYCDMNNKGKKITSSFNVAIPRSIDVMVIVFEIEIKDEQNFIKVCDDVINLKDDCCKIGFKRYIGDSFTRDFIFGNDYEISRILGCHLHTKHPGSFVVPSARIDFEIQDILGKRNYIIPEKDLQQFSPKLTGRFREYKCKIEMDTRSEFAGGHEVKIWSKEDKSDVVTFVLQPTPSRKGNPKQWKTYFPDTGTDREKRVYSREVSIQKFMPLPNLDNESKNAGGKDSI